MTKRIRTKKQLWLPLFLLSSVGMLAFAFSADNLPADTPFPVADRGSTNQPAVAQAAIKPEPKASKPASAQTIERPTTRKPVDNGSLVKSSTPDEVIETARRKGLTVQKSTPLSDGTTLVAIKEPKDHPEVLSLTRSVNDAEISTNYTYRALYTQTNPDTNYSSQWNLSKIQATDAWDITTGSNNSVIAVIDTGVLFSQTFNGSTYTQPDFPTSRRWQNPVENGNTASEGAVPNCTSRGLSLDKACNNLDDDGNGKVDDWQGWDFMGGFSGSGLQCPNHNPSLTAGTYIPEDNDPQPYSCDSPDFPSALNKDHYDGSCVFAVSACYIGHGTMVGSVAAAATNNGQLIAGIDHSAKIMNLRVLDGYGFTTTDLVAAAVSYAGSKGADVINMSLAVSDCSTNFVDPVLESAMLSAKNNGSVIVAASGNENIASVCYPASSTNALAVGSTDQNDLRSGFSNYGSQLDVVAPGSGIPVANAPSANINSDYYASANGTSLATPHVAGLAGLLRAMRPDASANEIMNLIKDRADIVPAMNGSIYNTMYGYGRINAYTSIKVAQGFERPLYRLYNPVNGCFMHTSSVSQRYYAVLKKGYQYQGVEFWETINSNDPSRPASNSHVCS